MQQTTKHTNTQIQRRKKEKLWMMVKNRTWLILQPMVWYWSYSFIYFTKPWQFLSYSSNQKGNQSTKRPGAIRERISITSSGPNIHPIFHLLSIYHQTIIEILQMRRNAVRERIISTLSGPNIHPIFHMSNHQRSKFYKASKRN